MFDASVLQMVQTVTGVITALAVFFAYLQVRLTARQLRKQSDKNSIEFVLNAEGQFDGMWEALIGQSATVIRNAVPHELNPKWNDDEVKAFVCLRRRYGHIARMVFLVTDESMDLGMSADKREEFIAPWRADLRLYKDNPIMRHIHEVALKEKTTSERMLSLSKSVFGE